MEAISLFAGIGGLELGLGVPVVAAYEIDGAACAVYERLAGSHIHQTDLTQFDFRRLPPADVLIGGPPCQEFSSAGHNAGADGERNMWPIALKAVEVARPSVFVFENVKGLTQGKHAPYFLEILAKLRGFGYVVDARILNAANYGVPQTRERVFIVGRRDGLPICWPQHTHWNAPDGLFFRRWVSWGAALERWFPTAEKLTTPIRNWLRAVYGDVLPETGMFDGHQKGGRRVKQHREFHEPSFTLVKSNEKNLVRMKVHDIIYRLDEQGAAILQTLPYVPGLTKGMIGNSVPPMFARALFSSLFNQEVSHAR